MIKISSLRNFTELYSFWHCLEENIDFQGLMLMQHHENTLYKVEQSPPLDRARIYNAIQLTAAFGSANHIKSILPFSYTQNELVNYMVLAIQNKNDGVFNYLFELYDFPRKINLMKTPESPILYENFLIELISAAAVSNNLSILNRLLQFDTTGYFALGVEQTHVLKLTPLYWAAAANAIDTFKRLLEYPLVKDSFLTNYNAFCGYLQTPSRALKHELNRLKPRDFSKLTSEALDKLGLRKQLLLRNVSWRSEALNSNYISSSDISCQNSDSTKSATLV